MSTEVIVAVLALVGTTIGSLSGVLTANRLTNYRIEQLEKKVDQHNRLGERVTVVEESVKNLDRRLDSLGAAG